MSGFVFTIYCLKMIHPTAAATLRSSQIVVAVVVQGILLPESLESIQTLGGFLILLATIAVIFDYQIEMFISGLCSCSSCRNADNRFDQVGRSETTSWLDIFSANSTRPDLRTLQPQPERRVRGVSISLS